MASSNKRTRTAANFSPPNKSSDLSEFHNAASLLDEIAAQMAADPAVPDSYKTKLTALSAQNLNNVTHLLKLVSQFKTPEEVERSRSIVIGGLAESKATTASARALEDNKQVTSFSTSWTSRPLQ